MNYSSLLSQITANDVHDLANDMVSLSDNLAILQPPNKKRDLDALSEFVYREIMTLILKASIYGEKSLRYSAINNFRVETFQDAIKKLQAQGFQVEQRSESKISICWHTQANLSQ